MSALVPLATVIRLGQRANLRLPRFASGMNLRLWDRSSQSRHSGRIELPAVSNNPREGQKGLAVEGQVPVRQLFPTPPAPNTTIWYSRLTPRLASVMRQQTRAETTRLANLLRPHWNNEREPWSPSTVCVPKLRIESRRAPS